MSVRVPGRQKLQMTALPGLAQDVYSCTRMTTVGVKGLDVKNYGPRPTKQAGARWHVETNQLAS